MAKNRQFMNFFSGDNICFAAELNIWLEYVQVQYFTFWIDLFI